MVYLIPALLCIIALALVALPPLTDADILELAPDGGNGVVGMAAAAGGIVGFIVMAILRLS
jgi:hypothetical protein